MKMAETRSDRDGKFFIELNPGDYDVALNFPEVSQLRVKVEPGKPTIVTLEKVILLRLKYCLHFQKSMRLYNWL